MREVETIKQTVSPQEILFVVDSMTGQDAVNSAKAFDDRLDFDGIVLTKLDGDARGGAALSIRSVVSKPIKFVGVGEKLDELEVFHPDRMASRILGMGDVVTLVEKAQEQFDEEKAQKLEAKLRTSQFTFEDFLDQLREIKKMGSLQQIMSHDPGHDQDCGRRHARREGARQGRGDHPIDDRRRAEEAQHHQRDPPQEDRLRERDVGAGSQQGAETVPRHAENDEDAVEGPDAEDVSWHENAWMPA